MKLAHSIQRNRTRVVGIALLAVGAVCVLAAAQQKPSDTQETGKRDEYVGSEECATCHQDVYEKYRRTDMGRSMVQLTPAVLKTIPTSSSMVDQHLNRHFELYVRDGALYQSEFEVGSDGEEVFRDTHKIEWIMGAGANGAGAIVRKGDYLFEAPLSYYSNLHGWALSPGYEHADYGFSRPVLPGCIVCHSGRPQPVLDGNGRFRRPPFRELAIGCENCHGPGGPHAAAASPETIVNPKKLTGWQADNICLPCHQTGDARVLRRGEDYADFRPGSELDETLSIFTVPFSRKSQPQDDLLEHYLSMRLSKCYRESGGKLSCITCHDPHSQPIPSEAPAYFRQRCLSCHTDKNCSLPLDTRQKQSPPDNCAGCHMPKRDVKVISHSVLTNHRIVRTPQEPFLDAAFHMTTPELPDLVHLSGAPGKRDPVDPLTLLQAYRQVMLSHPEYRERYWNLGKQLERKYSDDVTVLEAMADASLREKTPEGFKAAISYLDRARERGSTQPSDFEQFAKMLLAAHDEVKAVKVLQQGIELIPYDSQLYRLLGQAYVSLQKPSEACKTAAKANELFPQDDSLRAFLKQCETVQH